jgi:triacylglycerol lipase
MALSEYSTKDKGMVLALFANQCYQPPEQLFEPKNGIPELAPLKKFLNKPLPPTYINVDGAQAYVMSDKDDVLIACRGTEPTALNDVKADLNTFRIPHPVAGKVHQGFYGEYAKVMPGIKKALAKHDKKNTKSVWVCGHSLGGAMAVLVAMDVKPEGGLYTFGQPRVGNIDFLKAIDFPYFRYVNNNDVVPSVPPSFAGLWYKHQGHLRYINTFGNIRKSTPWQRFKDGWRGRWAAAKQFKFIDGVGDHGMGHYYNFIANMDDKGEQPK